MGWRTNRPLPYCGQIDSYFFSSSSCRCWLLSFPLKDKASISRELKKAFFELSIYNTLVERGQSISNRKLPNLPTVFPNILTKLAAIFSASWTWKLALKVGNWETAEIKPLNLRSMYRLLSTTSHKIHYELQVYLWWSRRFFTWICLYILSALYNGACKSLWKIDNNN